MNNNGHPLEQMLYVHVAMIMMRSIRRTTPPPMATCFFLFSHHICLCSFDSTFWNCLFLCVGVIRKYVQALSDITVFMLQKRNCVFEKNISTVDKNNQPRTVLCRQPACQPSHERLSLNSCYDIIWMGQNPNLFFYTEFLNVKCKYSRTYVMFWVISPNSNIWG